MYQADPARSDFSTNRSHRGIVDGWAVSSTGIVGLLGVRHLQGAPLQESGNYLGGSGRTSEVAVAAPAASDATSYGEQLV